MTTLLDAARKALDALEVTARQPVGALTIEAILALRQAIEQVEQQEPVAWIEHIAGGVEYNPYHKAALKLPEGMRFDLYTYPPQRKPLVDEAIRDLWSWSMTAEAERTANTQQHAFARAIERAHGITGDNT